MDRKLLNITLYVLISYSLAYLIDVIFYLLTGPYNYQASNTASIFYTLLMSIWGLIRMYTPALAVIVVLFIRRESILDTIRRYIRLETRSIIWYLSSPMLAYLSVLIFILFAEPLGLIKINSLNIQGLPYNTPTMLVVSLIAGYIASITINSIFALGEEIGWRGFLYESLNSDDSPVSKGLLIGLIWGFWHTPLILSIPSSYLGIKLMRLILYVSFLTSISVSFNILRKVSKSILPNVSLHGGINAIWGLTLILLNNVETPYIISYSMGIISWTIISIILYLLYHNRLKI